MFHADLVHRLTPVPAADQVASKSFILQVLACDVRLVLDGDAVVAGPGSRMRMASSEHQPITAVGEAVLLLTLLKG